MKSNKKKFLSIVLFIILLLGIWFVALDFSRFFNRDYSYDIFPSAVLKRICVILAAAIAWSVGMDGLDPGDSARMKAAFLFACLGETAFAAGVRLVGVGLFALCQMLLIVRHTNGFGSGLAHAGSRRKKLLLLPIVLVVLILTAFVFLFGQKIISNLTYTVIFLYAIILSISLWAALANCILRLLKPANSKMAAAGMLCFFCCDVLVGLDAALEVGLPWLLTNSFIWVFYIPALVLLALSCYSYDNFYIRC